jgi:hypothetical protein
MGEAKKGNKNPLFGINRSEETRIKISQKLGISVEILDLETNQVTVYDSISKAADAIDSEKKLFYPLGPSPVRGQGDVKNLN